ncbi:MAG: TatD family hydrolase [Bacteroidetes bacterium]|nr:TatD family hydrolase [Bacteroidota bacterium]
MNSIYKGHPIIDTHAHLCDEQFNLDFTDVINRAEDVNIKTIIIPSTDYLSAIKSLELAEKYKILKVAIGIHPHEAKQFSEQEFEKIENLIPNKNIVAIGEIGLEYYYDFAPKDLQKNVFLEHLKLAKKYNLPTIIHTRDSIDDAIKIIEEFSLNADDKNLKGVFHCFGGNFEQATKLEKLGYMISYPGIVTFKNSPVLETVKQMDCKFMLETDSPYLAPIPLRGKRNEPANIIHTLKKIAEVCNKTENQIADETTLNASKLFNLKLN